MFLFDSLFSMLRDFFGWGLDFFSGQLTIFFANKLFALLSPLGENWQIDVSALQVYTSYINMWVPLDYAGTLWSMYITLTLGLGAIRWIRRALPG